MRLPHISMPLPGPKARALIERDEASRSEIRHLAHRFFKNSHEMLVLNILEDRGVDAEELQRLRQLLEQTQLDGSKAGGSE